MNKDLRVTIIQSDLHWENIPANLDMFSRKLNAINDTTDLIILPEMFSTGFTMKPQELAEPVNGPAMKWMAEMAMKKNCVITGSVAVQDMGGYHNRLLWMQPDGSFESYDKRHLFRYGKENEHYLEGGKKLIVKLKGWNICPLVCYDLRFPVWSRNRWHQNPDTGILSADYDLLIYVANWPERRNHPWKTLLMARAMENQCYVAGVNRVGNDGNDIYHSGDSAVIDFKGELMSTIKPNKESIQTISLSHSALLEFRKNFPVGLDADSFDLH